MASTSAVTGGVEFKYDYDRYGNIIKREDRVNNNAIATLDYTYDRNDRLQQLNQSGINVTAQQFKFDYNKLNQLTQSERSTANSTGLLVTNYGYNAIGLINTINNSFVRLNGTSTNISSYNYDYDDGNRLQAIAGGTITYF
jgi:hypothetical protein